MKNEITAYRQAVRLPYGQYDISTHLALPQLALIFQEVAGDDTERFALGRQFMLDSGIFWVVSRLAVRIHRPVRWNEEMRVATWHGDPLRYVFPRSFRVEATDGTCLAEADSAWMLVDRAKREVVFPQMRGLALPGSPTDMPKARMPGKLSMDMPLTERQTRRPVYSDFDLNGHMNNARYLAWVCDLFPPGRYLRRYIDRLQVNFITEIMEGEAVELCFGERGEEFAVRGSVDGASRFEAMGSFADL